MKNLCFCVLLLVAAAACHRTDQDQGVTEPPFGCTAQLQPGLVVAVVDSASGTPLASASVIARAGTYGDSATFSYNGSYSLVYERAGTYSLTVQHSGYRDWRRDSVTVSANECHVNSVNVTARLQP